MEFLFGHFKVFRLHTKLHGAAGAVGADSGKGLGYCYMIGRRPTSCVLGSGDWTTPLLLSKYLSTFHFQVCLFLKQYVCYRTIYIEWADMNVIRALGVFLDRKIQGYSFRSPKKFKPTLSTVLCIKKLQELCGTVDAWNLVSFPTFLPVM